MLVVVVLHALLFFGMLSFCISGLLFSCHRHSILTSQTREGLHQLIVLSWRLLSIAFAFPSPASAIVLSGHFLPAGGFLPYAPSPYFCHNLILLSRPPWEAYSSSLKFAGRYGDLETQTRPICLSDS